MSYDSLLSLIEQFGYAALFFALWLGIVGMPIPDEVIVLTGGAVSAGGLLHPLPAFLLTYLGVVSGISLGYVLGRTLGSRALDRLRRKSKLSAMIDYSETLVHKYGSFALCISYFFPVVRHVMPYVVGFHRMPFRRYALFSYTTGFVWTILFFAIGRFVGGNARQIGYLLYEYGLVVAGAAAALAIVYYIVLRTVRARRRKRKPAAEPCEGGTTL
ncbi:DedA family protein [Paenibacillus flagellatus]|uniref:Alkaline phosphatase n=1 Tax=Paenibacillus flagellatus TaxID=2211139 RepID=A0A2V5KMU2_9BACL|nr:DedA family protein [Paenibacillus flagellatus]PYI56560.1 alkaline phosphatase [Paenibacillus flagellatus]